MSEKLLSFDQLVSKFVQRKMTHTILGLGDIELHELSGIEALELRKEASSKNSELIPNVDKLTISNIEEQFLAKWACRFLLGEMPTADQIQQLRNAQSPKIISEIYIAGCSFNITDETQKESLEKNLPSIPSSDA